MCLYRSERAREGRERDRWTAAIPNSISDPVLLSDDKGLVKFVNAAAERLLGTGLAQILNRRLGEVLSLVDAATREPVLFPVTEPLAEGRPAERRKCIVLASDGSEKSVELTASPLVSGEGTVFGILYVLQ
jgi:PAS domain S-box-containing protein